MALQQLDRAIFALDRRAEVVVRVNGEIITAGLDGNAANLKGVEIQYDIDQLPPTCVLSLVDIPTWVVRNHTIEIDAGFDGELERIFTGHVKRRRHGVEADTVECVGRTAVLTRPFRSSGLPKSWTSQTAVFAINDILDDLSPPFVPAQIDPIVRDDDTNWVIGTQKTIFLDSMSAADMIRKIADVYGHRVFELKSGMLRIRPLLEAPAPTGFRTYSTRASDADRISNATVSFDDTNIDAPRALGNVAANTRRSQGFQVAANGNVIRVSFWMQKVAAPLDKLRFVIENDSASNPGEPGGIVLGGSELFFYGSTLLVGTYTRVDIIIATATQLTAGTQYHLVVGRTSALDAVNYYIIGFDTGAGYADGIANLYDGATWGDANGDHPFEVVTDAFPTLRIMNISDDEDEDQVKKEVIVNGAALPDTDAEGNEIQTQITATRFTDSNDLINGDRRLYSMTYQNELIQTQLVADEVAQRLVNKYHRLLQSIEIEVPFDPRMELGTTIRIDDPEVSRLPIGNWWIRAFRHTLTPNGLVTQMSLFGGDQGGTSSLADPQADFSVRIERELIGNAIMAVVTFTANASDADGWITEYHWTDDYLGGVNDVRGEALNEVTFAYNPSTDPSVDMTLMVTDNDGNTASVTKAIDTTTGNDEAFAPVISCAAGNTCMATFTGALTWIDIATPNGDAISTEVFYNFAQPTDEAIVLFGTDTGRIYRSDDRMASLTLVLNDGAANDIVAIKGDSLIRQRVWAVTITGRVFRSNDFGATWNLYADLGFRWSHRHDSPGHTAWNDQHHVDPRPVQGLIIPEPASNRVLVFGGIGTDPETWLHEHLLNDSADQWHSLIANTAHGDAEDDSVASSTGNSAHTVVGVLRSHNTSSDLGLLFSGRNPPYMYASRLTTAESADWRNPTGIPAVDGRGLASNNNRTRLFGLVTDSRNFYRTQDGLVYEESATVLPGTGANRPNDLVGLTAWRDIFLSAMDEGIGKTIDFGVTWDFLRPQGAPVNTTWPVGAVGNQIAIVFRRPVAAADLMVIVTSAAADPTVENAFATRSNAGDWTDRGPLPTARISRPHRIYHYPQISNQVVFYIRYTSATTDHIESLFRSPDLGATWVDVLARAGALARANAAVGSEANARLWATWEPDAAGHGGGIEHRQHDIRFSTDNGLTWTTSFTNANTNDSFWNIVVDPNNPNRVMAIGNVIATGIVLAVTNDATAPSPTWSRIVSPTGLPAMDGAQPRYHNPKIIAGENGRWIIAVQTNAVNDLIIYTSDNDGSSWTTRDTVLTAASTFGYSNLFRAGNILFAAGTMINNTAVECLRSDDNGTTWTRLDRVDSMRAYVWDGLVNILIGGVESGVTTNLQSLSPPIVGQSWVTGLSEGLRTAMGYTAEPSIVPEGITVGGS